MTRKRPEKKLAAMESSRGVRFMSGLRAFVRENVRMVLIVFGILMLAQAVIPWTTTATDRVPFIIIGSIFFGLALPRRLWRL